MSKHKYTKGQIVYVPICTRLKYWSAYTTERTNTKKRQYWVWAKTGKCICVYSVMTYTSKEKSKSRVGI